MRTMVVRAFAIGCLAAASLALLPNTAGAKGYPNVLWGVSCSSTSSCAAVGRHDTGTNEQTLIKMWNGTQWTTLPSPDVSATQWNELTSVSCSSSSSCVAVGDSYDSTLGFVQSMAVVWDGSRWSIQHSANTSPSVNNWLNGVSCTSSNNCVAVGSSSPGSIPQTLVETWNGAQWTIIPSPNPPSDASAVLTSVSCVSASACVAAGYSYDGSHNRTLIETWNGSQWTIVSSPNSSVSDDENLTAVTCRTTSFCMATGYAANGSGAQTLVESWNGSQWTIVPSPNTSPGDYDLLYGVSCVSVSSCSAVGTAGTGSGNRPLLERWDGSQWSIATDFPFANQEHDVRSISCTSPTLCFVAGMSFSNTVFSPFVAAVGSAPQAPSGVSASAGDAQVTVSWSAAPDTASSYTVTASPGGASCISTTSSCTFTGLNNGTEYTFVVTASNVMGTSPTSLSVSATPNGLAATGSQNRHEIELGIVLFGAGGLLMASRRRKHLRAATTPTRR